MGCIQSKVEIDSIIKRLERVEAHMNLLDDDIYYIEKRLKRRGRKGGPIKSSEIDEYMSDMSNNSNDTTPPETVAADSPKTNSGMHVVRK